MAHRQAISALYILVLAVQAYSLPAPQALRSFLSKRTDAESVPFTAVLDGVSYVNKGLVGFGLIPSDFRESTGDTLGGIGSAMDIKYGTWKSVRGTFQGTFVVHPDRGFNLNTTVDYQSRQHEIDFKFSPYYGSSNLSFTDAQKTLQLEYKKTTLQFDRDHVKTSGLDPLAVRPARFGFPFISLADPQMPIASTAEPHLCVDVEGIISNPDGTFWISDEYGPYIYRYTAEGQLIQTIQPPEAFLPRNGSGKLGFTSETPPATGRTGNQGFEGLTMDLKNQVLYAMLQTATVQDGGEGSTTSRYTRLVAYDVSLPSLIRPRLVGEWVVPLPLSKKGKVEGSSEIHYVSPGVFLALARDGDGRGGGDDSSGYKQADLFSISGATDIHGTKFDSPENPISPGGVLDPSITPATYVSFANYLDPIELARFGLHNGSPNDPTLIDGKWESLVLASVEDPKFPDDFFLFTASDNDFISTNGVSLGVPFNAGLDVDNQFLVFRLTLPGAAKARRGLPGL